MLLRAAAIVVLLLCCAKESSWKCCSSVLIQAPQQNSLFLYQRRQRGHPPHSVSLWLCQFASLRHFFRWRQTLPLNVVNSLEKNLMKQRKRYEASSKIGEERLKRALDAESKAIQLRTAMQSAVFLPAIPPRMAFAGEISEAPLWV
ncbi:hypothetical protein PIB30_029098 [Stylosanthes scabra]|uniref:Uncharacterized protein n=1 Tax=Stylosanthes scabra TaxID=79078 RepID=A0ABU6UAL3_9FABA|nr:hypothetical protein [Stylosanthes scabra]